MDFQTALAAHQRGDLEAAVAGYRACLATSPLAAHHNLGIVLQQIGEFEGAEASLRRALTLNPTLGSAQFELSKILLATGRYAEGWARYEGRRRDPGSQVLDPPDVWPSLACPEWQGQDIRGKHLLVFREQGYGDVIMFARFLRQVEALGASCTYVCPPDVSVLFTEGHASSLQPDFPPAHYWALVGSLPHRLGMASIPPPYPIHAGAGGGGVGVVPTGRPTHGNDAHRSLYGADADQLLALGRDLRPAATGARSFLETAEIIAGLDLVISVDTSVAHLSASMGKPTWILLPARETDWRWMRDRADSPWYPSARLFRQPCPGDWGSVLAKVEIQLSLKIMQSPPSPPAVEAP